MVIRGVQSSAGVYAAQSVSEGAAAAFGWRWLWRSRWARWRRSAERIGVGGEQLMPASVA